MHSAFSRTVWAAPAALCLSRRVMTTLFAATPLLQRPQTIKPNPNETASGKFDKSFEKVMEKLESKMIFRQKNVKFGTIYDHPFGEDTYDEQRQSAKDDIEGHEKEKSAARQARSYFTGDDLSPEAMHVRSPHLKVAQNAQRQKYDKNLLKTTKEADDYYYPVVTLEEKRKRQWLLAGGWGLAAGVCFVVGKAGLAYMRTSG